jgi:hypothetical protein
MFIWWNRKSETFDISLSRASHSIKNLTVVDSKVYGDVEFLNNDNGKQADNFINNMDCRFGIKVQEHQNNIKMVK